MIGDFFMEKEKVLVSACLLGKNCKYDGKNNKNEKYPETKRHNPYKKARKQKYFNKFFILLIEVLQLILRFHLQSDMKRLCSF